MQAPNFKVGECSHEHHQDTLHKQYLVQFLQFTHFYEELIHQSIFLQALTFLLVLSSAYFCHEFINPLTRLVLAFHSKLILYDFY